MNLERPRTEPRGFVVEPVCCKAEFDGVPTEYLAQLRRGIEVPSDRDRFQTDLLTSVEQMWRGEAVDVTKVEISASAQARASVGLSQGEFARMLGVSARTSQDWEQGRREPTGAAKTLLEVAVSHPEVLRGLRR
jgi:putative transcriptional regulator